MSLNKIIAIAITDYQDLGLNRLENCYDDLASIIRILTEKYEFDDVEFIYKKEETTRKKLYARLNEYFINTLPDDNILLLFAGHGQYNDKLGMSYWQPSDADPSDPSSWINVNDVLAFIKAANALHIGIISDSCFSGAIFEGVTRGGGIDAFKNKKSREALTSGGIEKVSDGKKGERSPFANALIKVLSENEKDELPFTAFSHNVILYFDTSKKQTPMTGNLSDSGHEGGTFFFELKKHGKQIEKIQDKNSYLQTKLGHFFIPINKTVLDEIDKVNKIKQEKNDIVKKQRFEEAAALREKEKILEEKIIAESENYLKTFGTGIAISEDESQKAIQLDLDIENYKKEIEIKKAEFEKELTEYNQKQQESTTTENDLEIQAGMLFGNSLLFPFEDYAPQYSIKDDPAYKYFNEKQELLLEKYNTGIIQLYEYFKKIQAQSKSSILFEKEKILKEILHKIYFYEVDILRGRLDNSIDESINRKGIEIEALNWIRNRLN